MLAKVTADAEAVKTSLPLRKEEARKKAAAEVASASAAVRKAREKLMKSAARGVPGETDSLDEAIRRLDEGLEEVTRLMKSEDYPSASRKAALLRTQAAQTTPGK
jgi:hypothetical protein